MKQLIKSVRGYWRPTVLTPVLISFEVVIECIIPMVIAELVNSLQSDAGIEIGTILKYGAAVVVLALLSLTFGSVAGITCANASCGFGKNLRKNMFYSIQDYSFENIDRFSTSSLVTRLTTDVTNVQNAFMMIIRTAVRAPFMFVFAIVMAFVMGGKMAWIFVVVIPILGAGLLLIIFNAMPIFRRVFKKYDKLNASVQENVKGMRVVKSFVRENYEKQKFGAASDELCQGFLKADRLLALNGPIMQVCLNIVMIFVLSFGSKTVITSGGTELEIGHLSALLTYGFMILSSLMMLSMIFVMITMAGESAKRISEVLTEKPSLANPENPVFEVANGSVDFEDVSFKYSFIKEIFKHSAHSGKLARFCLLIAR